MDETIEISKNKLKILKDQGSDTCGVFKSFFHFFLVDQTSHCPEFVKWCEKNFSVSKGVIMNRSKSKILCLVHALVVYKSLHILGEFV